MSVISKNTSNLQLTSYELIVTVYLLSAVFCRYIEVFRSNLIEMQKRSRPPPLMSSRPGPYDRPGYGGRSAYGSRSRMRG